MKTSIVKFGSLTVEVGSKDGFAPEIEKQQTLVTLRRAALDDLKRLDKEFPGENRRPMVRTTIDGWEYYATAYKT